MHKDSASWRKTLAECGLLQYSEVKESDNGHVFITITASVSMEPNASDEQSEEAALEILSGCEISAIRLTYDGYGLVLESRYDGCTITFVDIVESETFDEENPDEESVQLDQELSEISWGSYPSVCLYNFLDEVVGSELANTFLRHCPLGVYLHRIYDPEECQRYLPRRIENSDYELWSKPAWVFVPSN